MHLSQAQEHGANNMQTQISFHLRGELNRTGVNAYKSLLKTPAQDIVLNLKNVSKIDSMGLGFLLKLQEKYTDADFRLELAELPIQIEMFLDFTGMISNFAISSSPATLSVVA